MKKIFLLMLCSIFLSGCSIFNNNEVQKINKFSFDRNNIMKKSYYLDLMEKTLSAYTTAHIGVQI